MNTKMKVKAVISFRPKPEEARDFVRRAEALGATDSELASLAFRLGIEQATKQLAAEKEQQAASLLKRMRSFGAPDFQPSGFELMAA